MQNNESGSLGEKTSFWEPGSYKFTTKRIENGLKLCSELVDLLEERADIEKEYAKSLQGWSKKWTEILDKGSSYGTMKVACKGFLTEGEKLARIHLKVKDELTENVIQNVRLWQKDNYHKGIAGVKERKIVETAIRKAQKPWAAKLAEAERAKQLYHEASLSERQAVNFRTNASVVTALSAEQLKKIEERVTRAMMETRSTRAKYQAHLAELNKLTPRYMEHMRLIFGRCQSKEGQQLQFFKETLFRAYRAVDLSLNPDHRSTYNAMRASIELADFEADLRWWADNHGMGSPLSAYPFEEFDEATPVRVIHAAGSERVLSATPTPTQVTTVAFALVDGGVPVRALYDYAALDQDELSFKAGDEFTRLEDEDSLGWCRGSKDGRIGLYPANFAKPIDVNQATTSN